MDEFSKDELTKYRAPLRTNFTKSAKQVEEILCAKPVDLVQLNVAISLLTDKFAKLEAADTRMLHLLSKDCTIKPEDLEIEYEKITTYADLFVSLRAKAECMQKETKQANVSASFNAEDAFINKKTVKLPKIELPKYDGSIKGWIGFWSLFKKIDEDPDLSTGDKFVYLIQSTAEGSRARELVGSYPPTDENYPLAVECLKSRFGKSELLIEVYVRELLTLVLNQNKCSLVTLYDKIEAHLRALGTLGVTSDKYAAMLYPLVESCLPYEVLKIWERQISAVIATNKGKEETNKLTALMEFLKSEVDSEQRLAIAKNSFDYGKETHRKSLKRCVSENNSNVPTASGLLNTNENNENLCIFCFKKHNSADCNKAKGMGLDERRDLVKKAACCFKCLKKGHLSKQCYSKIKCFGCHKFHCTLMCPNIPREGKVGTLKVAEESNSIPNKDQVLSTQSNKTGVLLQTLQVYLRGKTTRHVIRALIDTGSQHSYISSKAVELMNYECVRELPIIHSLFGGHETPQQIHRCIRVYLTSMDESYNCNFEALEQDKICGYIEKTPHGPWMKDLRKMGIHLTDVVTSSYCGADSEIHLLIGANVAGKLLNGKIHNLNDGPVAVGTYLGWTLMGKIPQRTQTSESCLSVICLHTRDINLPDLWSLDRIGITDPVERQTEVELHKAAYEHFQSNLKLNAEGRYQVKLPWLQFHPDLSEGRELAKRRLKTTIARLKAANILEPYQDVLHAWLKEGIVEEVSLENSTSPGHFLPHRAVVKNSATTKIRPVFDASAHTTGSPSLNECLVKGPNFLELIPTVLTRFRMKQYAVTADIKQAFPQISVCESDRNYLKFLWMEDGDATKLKTYRHCRVVFGLTCSPFLLNATLKHHLETAPPHFKDTALKLMDSFYVDNCLAGFDTVEDCELFIKEARELLRSGKFDLRGWRRNYFISGTEQVPNEPEEQEEGGLISDLGMTWDLSRDVLYCIASHYDMEDLRPVTKRKILATAQRIYDPLGMICPFTLLPKLLLQECWRSNISWDKELPDDISKSFLNWKKQIASLKDVSIPRWLLKRELPLRQCSLHVFADASKCAYAVCIFIRVETEGSVFCEFVSAKNRVCPLKSITIPRLELLACLIAVRLAEKVKKDFQRPDMETHYWTDSSNALCWIKKEDCWATFVANRAREIRKLSHPADWHHVPGRYNPADIPSRGSTIKYLIETKWLLGPEWLRASREEWPESQIEVDEETLNQERRKTVATNTEKEVPWYHTRLSSYSKLIRTIAWMKRFCDNAKRLTSERNYLPLTVVEIEQAELILLKVIQREAFFSISKPKTPTTLKVGQVVLVGSDNQKRLDWPMAKVLEIYLGKDKNPRVARVKTSTGELIRPYQRLYPLEAEEEERSTLIETLTPQSSPSKITKSGRVVKPVKRLDL